jgi:hypothetical protein
MKKMIIIISVVLLGFVLAVAGNSWAQREKGGKRDGNRGGHFQKWNKPAIHNFKGDRARAYRPGKNPNRPVHYFRPTLHKRHPNHKRYRFWRPGHPGWRNWQHRRPAVIHKHYGSAEGYAVPAEAFYASAAVSDSGFAVSVGVNKTN